MFEKDAEEYGHEHCCDSCKNLQARYRKVFKDGAEFGYNKANEWHDIKEIETQAEEIKKLKKELDVWKVAYSELTRHRDELKQELKKYKE